MRRDLNRPLKIAMIGCRGVPATFGGIEHHVEELGARLAARGHQVTVFCRANYVEERKGSYRGMRLRRLPTVGTKHLDAIVHSGLSTAVAIAGGFDILHYHAIGPGALGVLPRYLSRAKVALTVHGLDDERAKWGRGAKAVLKTAGWLSARVPDVTIVVSRDLVRHYREAHRRDAVYVTNGVPAPAAAPPGPALARLGLDAGRYLLFVGRFVPEKAPDLLLRAFQRVPGDTRLVLAGGSSFTDDYVASLEAQAARDPRVVLAGYVYGADLAELYANAGAFVLPSLLEGLPLTLLEAASYGTPVIASSIPPHVEVLGASGPGHRLVPVGDEAALALAMGDPLADPAAERAGAARLRDHVLETYSWDEATEATERLYRRALGAAPEPETPGRVVAGERVA